MNRIINFTNKESDLDALPDLRNIYKRIFTSVKHLDDMDGAFNVFCDCLQIVYNNLTPYQNLTQNKLVKVVKVKLVVNKVVDNLNQIC